MESSLICGEGWGGGGGGGGGGGLPFASDRDTGMLVVSLKSINYGFWSYLGCSRTGSTSIFSKQIIGKCMENKKKYK